MIEIMKAPPYATVQDLGFPRGRAWGLPPGGAMDPFALTAVNAYVHNPPGCAAIEWALGPLVIRCEQDSVLAALPMAEITVESEPVKVPWPVGALNAPAGVPITLVIRPEARFGYLAVRGGFDVPMVLGSRSTYLPGGFGGLEGRRLGSGDRVKIGTVPALKEAPDAARSIAGERVGWARDTSEDLVVRAIRGPQWERFEQAGRERFFGSDPPPFDFGARFTVDRASDRSGYRLIGPSVPPRERASLPSEAACPGAVQIPDNGQPIVLMRDGPTVGGYPKIAVVTGRDLARLAQLQPGRGVRFWDVTDSFLAGEGEWGSARRRR